MKGFWIDIGWALGVTFLIVFGGIGLCILPNAQHPLRRKVLHLSLAIFGGILAYLCE